MAWPMSQDYNEVIQSSAANFADPDLRSGQVTTDALGLPIPCSGNFADVYEVRCPNGSRWAVKCFTREVSGLRERYQEIARHLRQTKLPFTVDFSYLEKGICVAGRWYPVLKMQWVEGLTLNQFVAQYADKPAMLESLLKLWMKMAKHLRAAKVGHCDLQHGNVLLVPGANANSLKLRLIDYDGMWVPGLAGTKCGEVGHPSYQHPQRLRDGTYSLHVDRFPLLLVATALSALMVGGRRLWDKYDNGDNLLFRQQDLEGPSKSALLDELLILDPTVRPLAQKLTDAARKPLDQTPLLEEALPQSQLAEAGSPQPAAAQRPSESRRAPTLAAPAGDSSEFRTPAVVKPEPSSRPTTTQKTRIPPKLLAGAIAGTVALFFVVCAVGIGAAYIATRGSSSPLMQGPTPNQTNPNAVTQGPTSNPTNANPATHGSTPLPLKAPFTEEAAKAAQAAWAKHLGRKVEEEIDLGGGVKLVVVLIPPGTFAMGSPKDEKKRNQWALNFGDKFDAEIQHTVTITKPFYLGKYAVTQQQYEQVVGKKPSYFKVDGGGLDKVKGLDTTQFPVEKLFSENADEFCQTAGKTIAWGTMMLPSEAQWEYACRAGTQTPFYFGSENNGNQANCSGDLPYGTNNKGPNLGRTCEVRSFTPNAFGLYQMHGNVWQWCQDYYGSYEDLPESDPVQLNNDRENRRVVRGGCWVNDCWSCRAASRYASPPRLDYIGFGFRVCVRLDFDAVAQPTKPPLPPNQTNPNPMTQGPTPLPLKAPFTEEAAKAAQAAWAKHLGRKVEEEIDLGGGVKLVVVLIPPGTFAMGSPRDEKDRNYWENIQRLNRVKSFDAEIQHTVTITKPFYLGKYSVTQAQYAKVVGTNPSAFQSNGKAGKEARDMVNGLETAQFPVEMVSWEHCEAFCRAATKNLAWGSMMLPSEAQWEYACRAGTQTPFYFGSENNGNQTNCRGDLPYGTGNKGPNLGRTCEVRSFTPNSFGLYQMHGNVWQWCQDYYGPCDGLPENDPVQLSGTRDIRHVTRGGAWPSDAALCRSASRTGQEPTTIDQIGFRVAVRVN